MTAIGTKLTEGDAVYELVAQDGDGRFIVARLDAFAPPVALSAAEVAARFGVDLAADRAPDPVEAWQRLSDEHARVRENRHLADPGRSPEQVFAAAAKPKRRR